MTQTSLPASPTSPPSLRQPRAWHVVIVLLIAAAFYLLRLGRDVPITDYEALVGQTAREMSEAGNWILPRFCGAPRLEKPPLAYWTAGLSHAVTGHWNALTLRLPSVVSALGCLLLVWWLGRVLFDRRTAYVALWIAAGMLGLLIYARSGIVDMQLTFWCTLAALAFEKALRSPQRRGRRSWLAVFYVALGVGMLAKLPMPLAVVPPGLLAYLLVTRRLREIPRLFLVPGLLLFVGVFGWWVFLIGRDVGFGTLWLKWHHEFIIRYTGGLRDGQQHSGYVQFVVLLALVLPWTSFLPAALIAPYRQRYAPLRPAIWLPWCLLLTNVLIFGIAGFAQPHYLLPALPYAALLLGVVIEPWLRARAKARLPRQWFILAVLGVLMAMAIGTYYACELLVAPRAMIALTALTAGFGLLVALWLCDAGKTMSGFYVTALTAMTALTIGRATVVRNAVTWPGDYADFGSRITNLVALGSLENLRWFSGPDPRLVFHTNQRYGRVLDERDLIRELDALHEPYTRANAEALEAKAAVGCLQQAKPCFIVMTESELAICQKQPGFTAFANIIYRHPDFHGEADHDIIVVTNRGGTPSVYPQAQRKIVYPADLDEIGVTTTTRTTEGRE